MSVNQSTGKQMIPFIYSYDDYDDTEEMRYELKTPQSGTLNVYVQGEVNSINLKTPVFLTVHDVGTNHTEFHKLIEHPCMGKLKARSVWIHVELPGHEFDAPELPGEYTFPTMEQLSQDLAVILNFFRVKYCVALGEGAGANIVARFSMAHPDRVLGVILIHCRPTTADNLESRINGKRLRRKRERRLNGKNVKRYLDSYSNRTDITHQLNDKLKLDVLLVVSSSQPNLVASSTQLQSLLNPATTTLLKLDHCSDIFTESSETLAHNLLLFCQGFGLFSTLSMSRDGSICVSK